MSGSIQSVETQHENRVSDSLNKLAATILRRSLRAVSKTLKRAATKWREDVEHVHQLRVSCRRALAAVNLFDPLISADQAAWFRKKLKAILSDVGKARDLDVLMREQLPRCGNAAKQIGRVWIAERRNCQEPIQTQHRKLNRKSRIRKHVQALMVTLADRSDASTADHHPPVSVWIRDRLSLVSDRFFQSLSEAKDIPSMHRLRIDAKRLRYTIEILKPALEASRVQSLKRCLACLQEQLGSLQDHVVAQRHLESLLRMFQKSRMRKTLRKLIRNENTEIANRIASFQRWFESEGPEQLRGDIEKCLPS